MLRLLTITLLLMTAGPWAEARPHPLGPPQKIDFRQPPASVEEHFSAGMAAIRAENWPMACRQFEYVRLGYPDSSFLQEALYGLGRAYFERSDYDLANKRLNEYLDKESSPRHFEEAFNLKLQIAHLWASGYKRRAFGNRHFPRIQPARGRAVELYEEIYTALPGHRLGAAALFAHAELLAHLKKYDNAIERYQAFLLRFPRHELAPDCYLSITRAYLDQARGQNQNPDLLDLTALNVRKFRQDFPTDSRLLEAEEALQQVREAFAQHLYETGQFYERVKQPMAAQVYYRSVLSDFPNTSAADLSEQRLATLQDDSSDA